MDIRRLFELASTAEGADGRCSEELCGYYHLVHALMSFTSAPEGIIRADDSEYPYADVASGSVTLHFLPGSLLGKMHEYRRRPKPENEN